MQYPKLDPNQCYAALRGGPCNGDHLSLQYGPSSTLRVPMVNDDMGLHEQGIVAGSLALTGYLEYDLVGKMPGTEAVYLYEFKRKEQGRMWCGYCHGSHDDFAEIMSCRKEAEEIEISEEFWTPQTVTGYRGFSVDWTDGVPTLRGVKETWKSAEPPAAQCIPFQDTQFRHVAPKVSCMCGYYAFKRPEDVAAWTVEAKVEMWGNVIEHEKGYRSEYVRLLTLRSGRARIGPLVALEALSERYGVPTDGRDW